MVDEALLRPLPDLLRKHADRIGGKVAFRDARRGVSYGTLAERTGRLAGQLAALGLERGARMAIYLDNCVELVESVLAGVRAAAVGVLLNPGCTDVELALLLDDCGAGVLVTDPRHLPQVSRIAADRPGVCVVVTGADPVPAGAVSFDGLVAAEPAVPPRDDLGLDEAAWMHYTSGTTGTPKGVVSTQRAALWSVAACYAPVLRLSETDRLLWPLPMGHVYAHSLCIVGVTAVGATARVVSEPAVPGTVLRLLDEESTTVLAGVPTTYHQLLNAMPDHAYRPATLRVCVTAGAPSTPELRSDVEQCWGVRLLDGYGSTETCGKIAVERPDGPRVAGASGPPVSGVEVRLLDPTTGQEVPSGADGEIWVRTPGLMLGYHGQPDATAEVVVDGWYRTGDVGRIVEYGQLLVTGRTSDLIIRGGENLYPAEIEQTLRTLPGVLDAIVVGQPDPLLGEVPVAFVVPAGAGVDPDRLRLASAERLSAVKVPEEILLTPAIPRTPSGKPLRRLLAEGLTTPATSAATPVRHKLAGLTRAKREAALRTLVRAETVAVCGLPVEGELPMDTPFAALGVTSLGAVTLWRRLHALTGLRLPPTLVYDHPSPTEVAGFLYTALFRDTAPAEVTDRQPAAAEPIAIVAMGCRYPGDVATPEDLWELVKGGIDATTDFPTDRGWDLAGIYDPDPERIGRSYTRRGGFLHHAADFDPAFFGISPREALATDPQQRLLLEVSWEVLERAGIPPASLRGTPTGVFVGVMHGGYGSRLSPHDLEGHLATGSAGSVTSGRISYTLGLRGPTITVDTACSSSLVAMHLAAKALRTRECSLALAGGVTVMSTPAPFIAFSRQRGLSPDGRCRSFAAGADGTGWAEGVGVVLLERLVDARRNGRPVLAVLRGSAVNSDGASNGLTAPNGAAQRELIRLALADARLSAADVDAVEGHGTATTLGDPIEAQALLATYGQGRPPDRPLWLGSVKSNIGHAQAAAGVAGIIKMVQALRHGELPRSLHAEEPSPHVDWSAGAVSLLARPQPWPAGDRPRRAGVSSFGIGGTNAHVIIEEAPVAGSAVPEPRWPTPPWLVSAADEAALRAQARRLADRLDGRPEPSTLDVGFSLATTRTSLDHRAALLAGDRAGLVAALGDLARGTGNGDIQKGTAQREVRLGLLFTGQGAQRIDMGRQLADLFTTFRDAFDEACRHLDPYLQRPLRDVLYGTVPELLDRTDFAQAALFAFEVALVRLLESWGIRPDYLVGHSVGELAAAHVAGVLSLADAARLVAARGRLMAALPTGGAMVAVQASVPDVEPHLAGAPGRVSIAAVNGPASVVVSGDEAAVTAVAAELARAGRRATRLRVSHAFHSPLVEPMLDRLREVAEELTYHRPTVAVVSTLTGAPDPDGVASAAYWVRHARETVRFGDAVRWLTGAGVTALLEVGPEAVLSLLAEECTLPAPGPTCVAAVHSGASEAVALLASLARLHVRGLPVDWNAVYAGSGARRCDLPTYAFQRRRYWLDPTPPVRDDPDRHPLLGPAVPAADGPQVRYTGSVSTQRQPWLADHAIGGTVVVPATAFVEMALHAAAERGAARLDELTVLAPLYLPDPGAAQVQMVVGGRDETGRYPVEIYARPASSAAAEPWTKHVTGVVAGVGRTTRAGQQVWPPVGSRPVDIGGGYDRLAAHGQRYGPALRGVTAAWRLGRVVFAEVRLPGGGSGDARRFGIHPALLDAALHASALAGPADAGGGPAGADPEAPRVPFAFTGVELYAVGADAVRVEVTPTGPDGVAVTIVDLAGRPVAAIESLVTRPLTVEAQAQVAAQRGLLRPEWTPVPIPATATPDGGWAVIGEDRTGLGAILPMASGSAPPAYLLLTVSGDEETAAPPQATRELTASVLSSLQRWQADGRPDARLVVVTRNATADDPHLPSATVWGLLRSVQSENPGRIVLVDLDGSAASAAVLVRAVAAGEPQLAIRNGTAYAPRLAPVADPATAPATDSHAGGFDPTGTVLITGGTGALGALVARHLVARHGVRHVLLASRRGGRAAGAGRLLTSLTELGAQARIVSCDVTDRAAVDHLVAGCRPALTAVVHVAGTLDDGVLDALTPERMATVLAPKVDAAWNLHESTRELGLSAFVLYSSASGLFGRPGQANYAAANAFLDALARHRVARGLPALSMAWGPWATQTGEGMAGRLSGGTGRYLTDGAILPVTPEQGMAMFDRALRMGEPVLAPVLLNLDALRERGSAVPPMLSALLPPQPARPPVIAATSPTGANEAPAPGWWRRALADLPLAEREPALSRLIVTELAMVLGFPDAESFPAGKHLTDLGFDSLTAVQLRNRLSLFTGVRLSPTLVLDHPTLAELTAHVHQALSEHLPAAPVPAPSYRFASLYHRVIRAQGPVDAMAMRYIASYALPSFSAADRAAHAVPPVRLAQGDRGPTLVYVPDYLSLVRSAPTRLAGCLGGYADLLMVEHPGLGREGAVPDSLDTLAATHAETVRQQVGDEPVALVGFCSGGAIAHATAGRLAATGPPPAGLVLIDTHHPTDIRGDDRLMALVARDAARPPEQFEELFDDGLVIAGGAYSRMFEHWSPGPVAVPTVLVRAETPTEEMRSIPSGRDWRPCWPLPHDTVDIPGTHFTVLDEDAGTTAAAIRDWVERTGQAGGAE